MRKSSKRKWFFCAGAAVVFSCLCVFGVGFSIYAWNQPDDPTLHHDVTVNAGQVQVFTFSSEQQTVIDQRGNPEGFLILFYDELLDDGVILSVRQETWYYYTAGFEITFKNGEIFSQEEVDPYPAAATRYSPGIFTAEMTLAQVLAATGQNTFLVDPVEDELVPASELVYLEGLACGMVDGRLRYIESVTIGE